MRTFVIAALLLAGLAKPARSSDFPPPSTDSRDPLGWRLLRWGMSLDQAQKALSSIGIEGPLRRSSPPFAEGCHEVPYADFIGADTLSLRLCFRDPESKPSSFRGALRYVDITMRPVTMAQYGALGAALASKYGEPLVRDVGQSFKITVFVVGGTQIILVSEPHQAGLIYEDYSNLWTRRRREEEERQRSSRPVPPSKL